MSLDPLKSQIFSSILFLQTLLQDFCDTGSCLCLQGKRTNLRKPGSERIDHSMRVKFNPLALLLDSSLEGEFDLVQRIIYEVRHLHHNNTVFVLQKLRRYFKVAVIFLYLISCSQVEDPSQPNDEGITALHNAVCAGHTEIVKFLVQFGVNVNAADSDGWYVQVDL